MGFALSVLTLVVGCQAAPAPTVTLPAPAEIGMAPTTAPPTAMWTVAPTFTPPATPTATPANPPMITPTPAATPALLELTDNYLVLGIDHREGDPDPSWRTDTIMVVAIDHAQTRVGIVNIPRDLYVEIPGYGQGRINQADYYGVSTKYPGGGPALLRRVMTATLGIPSQHYVRVKMEGLVELVDALGGVTVTLDCPLYERTPDDSSPNGVTDWELPAGDSLLDGVTAKKFATYRYVTSDFGRAQRQQQLIWAIRNRALQLDVIPRIPKLWKALAHTFTTDLNVLDVVKLARLGIGLRPENVHGRTLSDDALEPYITEQGAWVLVIKDRDKLSADFASLFEGRPLAQLGKSAPGDCPPRPTLVPTFTPTPDQTATPEVSATPTPG
ncbi:MAG: hypothetical protein CVU38_06235 [Chloroflexi bacterium HGW-Chloroflexi-1]|nr:MAG: hypothetical protein CVU38_06235 [Chloroflexi bacterium HGW-Chloroflexi-1]